MADSASSVLVASDAWRSAFPGAVAGALAMRGVSNPEHSAALDAAKRRLEERLRAGETDADAQPVLRAYVDYYILAGLVIERATHSNVARQLHRRLLERARFPRVVLQGDERPRGPVAVGYQDVRGDADLEPTPNNGYVPSTTEATTAWTAGGMLASAKDLARAGDGLFRGSLISEASRREMTHFIPTRMRFMPEYGLGLARTELGGVEVWTHSGNIFGFHGELAYIPEHQVTVAALQNTQTNAPGQEALIDLLVAAVSDSR